ncbi:MAG: glycine cleavage system protein H [Thermodesulfobacteriota bacterium]
MDKKKNYYQLIPKKELKCVWMTAGLLSYKLCKYDLQCEKCPLDWELRNQSATPSFHPTASQERGNMGSEEAGPPPSWKKARPTEGFLGEDLSLLNIKRSLFYHPGHTWIEVEKADEVRVGLDHFLGKIIGKVKVVVLPLSGKRCLQGENLCSIIHEEGILHIVFPVSGLILSVNQKLKDRPELISRDPLGDGFLLTLKPKNLQRDQKYFFFGETALSWCQKEWERFKAAVISELYGQERVGMTMQDGGMRLSEIKKLVDPERYIQLVSTFLRKGEEEFSQPKYKKEGN